MRFAAFVDFFEYFRLIAYMLFKAYFHGQEYHEMLSHESTKHKQLYFKKYSTKRIIEVEK